MLSWPSLALLRGRGFRHLGRLFEFLGGFAMILNHALSELFYSIAGTFFLSELPSAISVADPSAASLTNFFADMIGSMAGCVCPSVVSDGLTPGVRTPPGL